VACSGVHGANRLASNSLLEAAVFGRRLGAALSRRRRRSFHARGSACALTGVSRAAFEIETSAWATVRQLMWDCLGIERCAQGLRAGRAQLAALARQIPKEQLLLQGRLRLAEAMLDAALVRERSIGAHCRSDCTVGTGRSSSFQMN